MGMSKLQVKGANDGVPLLAHVDAVKPDEGYFLF
jgi:hypothetical protein